VLGHRAALRGCLALTVGLDRSGVDITVNLGRQYTITLLQKELTQEKEQSVIWLAHSSKASEDSIKKKKKGIRIVPRFNIEHMLLSRAKVSAVVLREN